MEVEEITEEPVADAAVRDERRRRHGRFDDAVYRTAFEASPLPICLFDMEGNFVLVNDAFCTLLEAPAEEILGRHVSAYNEPVENPDSEANLQALRGGQEIGEIHRRLRTTTGRVVHVTTRVTVLHHEGVPVGILSMVSDVTSHIEAEDRLRQLALHDPLTGLANRHQLPGALADLEQAGRPAAICFADLDRFKRVNDHFGHQRADDVLRSIGDRLRARLDPGDIALRLGGDEIAVVRSEVSDHTAARAFGTQVLDAINHEVTVGDRRIEVRASVGVAFSRRPGPRLLDDADAAMYQTKRARTGEVLVVDADHGGVVAT